ncbi:LacI family transcriptional regulator [Spinactinospora alkalitolerans]|uniref:LacI family transcriptional regulator n=1 Tax=Spinactinospora alkalitolerans TaxID=687207 RepID=A0A852U1N4_9ACTN|nr:LacI family DNA-binding transcriptional regulator [Spinactinospora alkalitolerans]NYE49272.1 LacI family transcriptional regulator [Spinactinospora alkalitolerans]
MAATTSQSSSDDTRRPVGIGEVAARAGVSPGTVSNVLNRPERVAEATRRRVEEAIRELDYVRNSSGSSLRSGRTDSIGLLVLDVTNPFFTEVARGVEDEATAEGLAVLLLNSAERADRQRRSLRLLAEQRAAGAVVMPIDDDLSDLLWLRQRGISWVLLDRGDIEVEEGCSVCVDNHAGGLAAGRHLISLGHERISFVSGPFAIEQCRDRLAGLRSACAEAGLDPHEAVRVVETPQLNARSGEDAAEAVLAGGPRRRPQAVFCANDQLALGLLKSLGRRGIRAPEDISVMGYDDIDVASLIHPGLTSVAQPKYEMGRAAMRLLLAELNDPGHRHERLRFEPTLVARGSTSARR